MAFSIDEVTNDLGQGLKKGKKINRGTIILVGGIVLAGLLSFQTKAAAPNRSRNDPRRRITRLSPDEPRRLGGCLC